MSQAFNKVRPGATSLRRGRPLRRQSRSNHMQAYHNETIPDLMFPRPPAQHITSQDPKAPLKDKHAELAIESRSLLRAILRECTYLPDPQARRYVHQQALAGFRRWITKAKRLHDSDGIEARLMEQRKEARSISKELNRANQGEPKMLRKFLMATYGRSGKRRWELLEPLLGSWDQRHKFFHNLSDRIAHEKQQQAEERQRAEETAAAKPQSITSYRSMPSSRKEQLKTDKPVTSSTKTKSQTAKPAGDKGETPEHRQATPHFLVADIAEAYLPAQLRQLIRSQGLHELVASTQGDTSLQQRPRIPSRNEAGLPMPMSRVRNMTKDWYNNVISSALPPLPEDEWNHLRDLASTMRHPHEVLIPRRRGPAAAATPMSMLELVVSGTILNRGHFENRFARNMTPRAMQRMWAEVFKLAPLMSKSDEDKYWKITWGSHAMKPPRPAVEPEESSP